jgi:hypothetical protein
MRDLPERPAMLMQRDFGHHALGRIDSGQIDG